MLGMTGYSYKETLNDKINIITEIKSVNSRFLDIIVNMPYYLNPIEINVRNLIKEKLNRGKIEINVSLKQNEKGYNVKPNLNIAEQYINSFRTIINHFNIKDDIRLFHLTKYDDIFQIDKDNDYSKYWDTISINLNENITEILKMKEQEGEALKKDILLLNSQINDNVLEIEKKVPKMEKDIYNNLKEKIKELIGENVDEVKLLNETAFLVNKSCINEEIIRLKNYIDQFYIIVNEKNDNGKKLDFICQEMHREINTIGCKITLVELTNNVISIKNYIEKIREQLRNIE